MNNMTEELSSVENENCREKINLTNVAPIIFVGIVMALGLISFMIKVMWLEYVEVNGILHELFFLIPSGFILLLFSAIIIIGMGIRFIVKKRNYRLS